jgi:hypothetical protein
VKHVISRGERYGRLTVIREVLKVSADGKRYRAALCPVRLREGNHAPHPLAEVRRLAIVRMLARPT